MLQPRAEPLAGKRRAVAVQPQHELVPLDLERRARKHSRLRRRYQIGDAHCGPEHSGMIEHSRRGEFAQSRRKLVVLQHTSMTEKHRKR